MTLKIRLRQQGRIHRPFYRVVVTDSRNPRDGRYVESLGWYNPLEADDEKKLNIREDRIQYWVDQGALMSEKTEALVAQAAPNVIKTRNEKKLVKLAKTATKRRARKKAKA